MLVYRDPKKVKYLVKLLNKNSFQKFFKHARKEGVTGSSTVLEITYHKLRESLEGIHPVLKLNSRKWLKDRGYSPLRMEQ